MLKELRLRCNLFFCLPYNTNVHNLIKMKITAKQILNMHSKAMRETTHTVKPIVTTDKKKQANKFACRKKDW